MLETYFFCAINLKCVHCLGGWNAEFVPAIATFVVYGLVGRRRILEHLCKFGESIFEGSIILVPMFFYGGNIVEREAVGGASIVNYVMDSSSFAEGVVRRVGSGGLGLDVMESG